MGGGVVECRYNVHILSELTGNQADNRHATNVFLLLQAVREALAMLNGAGILALYIYNMLVDTGLCWGYGPIRTLVKI